MTVKASQRLHHITRFCFCLFWNITHYLSFFFQFFFYNIWPLSDHISLGVAAAWLYTLYFENKKNGMLPLGFLSSSCICFIIMVFAFISPFPRTHSLKGLSLIKLKSYCFSSYSTRYFYYVIFYSLSLYSGT